MASVRSDDWDVHWTAYADSTEENPAQRYRRRLIDRLLAITEPFPRILDIGSGQGDLVAELARKHPDAELLGVELSQTGVDIADTKVPEAMFVQWDLVEDAEVPEKLRGWATHATCSEVLEHVDDPVRLLVHARAFLAPGARLVITVPGGPRSAFDRHIGHRRHYGAGDLRAVAEAAGLEVESVTGAGFPFFNLYRLVVVARGQKLVDDVARSPEGAPATRLALLVMRVFGVLFELNLARSPFGWQTVAVCKEPQ